MIFSDHLRRAMRTPAGLPVRWAWTVAVRLQLAHARWNDARHVAAMSPEDRARIAREVTMVVKTFERPATIQRMVRSAREIFDGRIVIADDSRHPLTTSGTGVDVIALPFNSGVCVGRNAALDAVQTEFTLVSDDDIFFTRSCRIDRALDYMHRNPEVDIVGFARIELPRRYVLDHGPEALFEWAAPPLRSLGQDIDGLPVRYKVEQIYLARTDSLHKVRWNERLRMVDHSEFFTRASGKLLTVFDTQIATYHARTPMNANYTKHREDIDADLRVLEQLRISDASPD